MIFKPCNICGCERYREICDIEIAPYSIRSKLVKCDGCGFFYANPRPEREFQEDYFSNSYHEIQGEAWQKSRVENLKRYFRRMAKFTKNGRLADVGCGMGYFMDLARSGGWEARGVEISNLAVSHARDRLKLDVIKGGLKDARFKEESFDAVTMWNVLDEVYDPKSDLIESNRILKKGGYIFIRVPNAYFHLRLFKLYKRLRRFFLFRNITRPPTVFHPYSFDKDSITRLLKKAGFSKVAVKKEPLDTGVPRFIMIFGRERERIVRRLFDAGAAAAYILTLGKIIISPSIFVMARK